MCQRDFQGSVEKTAAGCWGEKSACACSNNERANSRVIAKASDICHSSFRKYNVEVCLDWENSSEEKEEIWHNPWFSSLSYWEEQRGTDWEESSGCHGRFLSPPLPLLPPLCSGSEEAPTCSEGANWAARKSRCFWNWKQLWEAIEKKDCWAFGLELLGMLCLYISDGLW